MTKPPNLKDINGLELDQRVWAYDQERGLAEIALKGRLEGNWQWLEPKIVFFMHNREEFLTNNIGEFEDCTQILAHEDIELFSFDIKSGLEHSHEGSYLWIRTLADSRVGYVFNRDEAFEPTIENINYRKNPQYVQVLRGNIYIECNLKDSYASPISYGSRVYTNMQTYGEEKWLSVDISGVGDAFIQPCLLKPSNLEPLEWVQQFLGTPWRWGGRTAWGIDCSGLVQIFFRYRNIYIPRDADQQEAAFTAILNPQAGDLAFFEDHVGILFEQNERGNWRILHANTKHMRVTIDTLNEGEYGEFLARLFRAYGRWEGEIGVYWKPE